MVRLKGFTKLTPLDEALEKFFQKIRLERLPSENISLSEAFLRVLAVDVIAEKDIPRFDRSAVDGYAIKAEDTLNASVFHPKKLMLVESDFIKNGEARAVWTGQPLPDGADAVIMLEHTKKSNGKIEVLKAVAKWENVSKKGEDVKAGELVLKAGTRLKPWHLGLLAALGYEKVEVVQKPKVAIFATGNELVVEIGEEPEKGKVIETNRLILSSMCRELGAQPVDLGIVPDREESIKEKILEGAEKADIIVSTGGTSVGKADLVPETINKMENASIIVHGIAIRPAMPTALAVVNNKPFFILSGNPVAAIIGFEVFVRSAILRLLGAEKEARFRVKAKLARRVAGVLGRKAFLRVKVYERNGEFLAEPVSVTGSGVLTTMTKANGFVVIPENREGLEEGEEVAVYLFDNIERDENHV